MPKHAEPEDSGWWVQIAGDYVQPARALMGCTRELDAKGLRALIRVLEVTAGVLEAEERELPASDAEAE